MPPIHSNSYSKYQEKLFAMVKNTAWEAMKEAGKEEAKLALESGEVDENGIPCITVVADGAWSKRSNRTYYNAASGVVCIKFVC